MLKQYHHLIMKIILMLFIAWSLTGLLYFAIETYNLLDDEATRNIDLPTPIWLTLAYGPVYWLISLVIHVVRWLLSI